MLSPSELSDGMDYASAPILDPPPTATATATATVDYWSAFSAIKAESVLEVLAEETSRPTFVLDELIHGRATLLYGAAKSGKSHLVVDLVTAVSRGQAWYGRRVNSAMRRVLVLSSDPGGRGEYARRLGEAVSDMVRLARPPSVGDRGAWRRTAQEALASRVGLLVLDNLYSWARVADINSSADVGAALACLDEVTEAGIPLLVVHHTSKAGTSPAGVHAIEGYFRHLLHLTGDGKLTVRGNDVPGTSYRLIRWEGRTVEVLDAGARRSVEGGGSDPTTTPGARPPSRAQLRREERLDRAERVLAEAPPGLSLSKQYQYLVAHMDGITTLDQAKTQVQNLRAQGRLPSERAMQVRESD